MKLADVKAQYTSSEPQDAEVLIISFDYEADGIDYKAFLKRKLRGSKFARWKDLSFVDGEVLCGHTPLSAFEFVLLGVVGSHLVHYTTTVEYLKERGVPFLSYGASADMNNKALQTVKLKACGVSQPKTVIGQCSELSAVEAVRELGLPLVAKIVDGSQGKGVEKLTSSDAVKARLRSGDESLVILQQLVPNDGDWRCFFIEDELVFSVLRKSKSEKEFRNNVSLGGTYTLTPPPAEVVTLARVARDALGFDVSGVDVIQDRDTKLFYVLEVNSASQFTYPEHCLNTLVDHIKLKLR